VSKRPSALYRCALPVRAVAGLDEPGQPDDAQGAEGAMVQKTDFSEGFGWRSIGTAPVELARPRCLPETRRGARR
jgi:hypothetical protein